MMIKNCFVLAFVLFSTNLFAQISVDFPKERQVFQRQNFDSDNNFQGDGMIRISGTFTGEYDSIMAKVEPRVVGQGTTTSWQKIHTRNGKPYFKGTLNAKGGWYRLSIKALKDGSEVGNDVVQRVGIGEVFVIAGQSNAQGGGESHGLPGLPAIDDRVSSVDFDSSPIEDNKLVIGFSKPSKDSSSLGPFHYVPWSWTRLGDLLTNRLNVPILFYGAGHGGTSIEHWEDSSQGRITPNIPSWLRMDKGAPYKALGATLEFYASLTGVRAVLWHQGESDHETSANIYQKRLETTIAQSRKDIEDQTLAWMVAKASYAGGSTSSSTLKGQQQTIDADVNVFNGPNTDVITGTSNRIDLTHMTTAKGLAAHANVWFESMIDSNLAFFKKASSVPAKLFIDLDCTCDLGNDVNTVTLSPTSPYEDYAWSNRDNTTLESMGVSASSCCSFTNTVPTDYQKFNWEYDSTRSINANSGRYALNVRKPTSNLVLFSPIVRVNSFTYPANPYFSGAASKEITLFLDESGSASLAISDLGGNNFINCEVELSLSQTSFSVADLGEQIVVYTAVSKNNSSQSVDLKVTVVDNIQPSLTVKNVTLRLDAQGILTLRPEDVIVESSDNTGIVETAFSKIVFNCSDIGENRIFVTVKDASGNEMTQVSILTIPFFTESAPKEITLFLDETGSASLATSDLAGNSFINCEVELSLSKTSFSRADLGEQTVVYAAVSRNNSRQSVGLKVTVVDNIQPTLTVKRVTLSLDDQGVLILQPEDIIAESFDNNIIVETTFSKTVFSCLDIGENKILVTVKDASGNEITEVAVLTIADGQGVCLCSYIILASESVSVTGSRILSGGIGTNSSGKTITLTESTFGLNAFVKSGILEKDSKSQPSSVLKGIAVSAPAFEWNVFNDKTNKKVKESDSETTSDNHFKKVILAKDGSLTFTGNKDIYIKKLKMKKGSVLNVNGEAKIHLIKKPKFWEGIQINSGLQSLEIFSEGEVVIKRNSTINANIHSKSAIEVLNSTNISGLFTGTIIKVGENVEWNGSNNNCDESSVNNGARLREGKKEVSVDIKRPVEHFSIAEKEQGLLKYGSNPSNGDFSIFFNQENLVNEKVFITVFDELGRTVLKTQREIDLLQSSVQLDLRKLDAGSYFIRVKINGDMEHIKLVIE